MKIRLYRGKYFLTVRRPDGTRTVYRVSAGIARWHMAAK